MSIVWPTGADAWDYLLGTGLVTPQREQNWSKFLELDRKASAAKSAYENAVGRAILPTTETRPFDPPTRRDGRVFLQDDLLSLSSLTLGGVVKVRNTDFWTERSDGGIDDNKPGKPVLWVRLAVPCAHPLSPSQRGSLLVAGDWGLYRSLPDDIWNAAIVKTLLLAAPQISLTISRGLLMWNQRETREEYGHYADQAPLSAEKKDWKASFDESVGNHTKMEVGL